MTTSASSSSTRKDGGATSPSRGGRPPPAIAASSSCPSDERSVARQRRDALEVARLGEHVEGLDARDAVAGRAQRDEVADLGLGIARNVDDRARRERDELLEERGRAAL